ncbi:MAG: hydrolase [Thermoleophilia bacterium]|nr:hydrolase [Thermoleophilia bacterium]
MTAARFCSSCGTSLPSSPPVTCQSCGSSHWRNPKPCANVVVVDQGKVLLVRRGYAGSPWHGAWCAPGGFCELGEHPIETAEREVREETGLRVVVTGYIGVWVDEYTDEPGQGDAEVINVAYYHAAPTDEREGPVDANEVSEIRWFDWDHVPNDLAPPGTLTVVLTAARLALDRGIAGSPVPDRPL